MELISQRRFEELVADALDAIPDELAQALDNVAVIVEDEPTPAQRAEHGSLLGLYEGVSLADRSPFSYGGVLPDRITVFRRSLCALAHNEADLADQVRVTVIHELAHHFGIDDARLDELGWA